MTAIASPSRPKSISLPVAASGVHPPPFLLPGEHFIAALLWLAIGAVGLVLIAPQLAAGNIFDPRVFAVTHCFTVGVIATGIFGALYQLFPVTMGLAVRSVRAAHLTFWLLQIGIMLIVGGFWWSRGWAQGAGWIATTVAVGMLGANLISGSLGAQPDALVGRYVAGGYVALVGALALGSLRIGETLGYWHVNRLAMIASHFHLAAVGFATGITVGVGSRMLPMFLVSHGFPRWPLRWSGPIGGAGLVALVLGQFLRAPALILTGGSLLAAAVILQGYLGVEYFRRRLRRVLDPGLAHVAVAFVALAVAAGVGVVLLASGDGLHVRLWAVYALLVLLGWLVFLLVGVLYKVLPFLTWLHLFGARMGEAPPVAKVGDLTRPAWGWASLCCLASGLAVMVVAIGLGTGVVARAGAVAFAVGVALIIAQAARVIHLRHRP